MPSDPASRLLSWIEGTLPGEIQAAGGEPLRRARVVHGFALTGMPFGIFFSAEYLYLGSWVGALACLSATAACASAILLLRHTGKVSPAAHVLCAALVFASSAAGAVNRGYPAGGLMWLIPVPFIAMLAIGRRSGPAWTAVSAAAAGLVLILGPPEGPWQVVASRPVAAVHLWTGVVGLAVLVLVLAYLHDLGRTEDEVRREALVALRRANAERMESLGALATGVAHDFNNLLTIISSRSEFLQETAVSRQDREDLEAIREATRRGAELTRRLLLFSRKSPTAAEVVDLHACVNGVRSLLTRTIGDEFQLELQVAADLPRVRVAELERLLINLVVNAREAMPGGGRVTVEVDALQLAGESAEILGLDGGRYARIRVTDQGHGIAPELRGRIFEPFFSTKQRGSGLGLAICHGVAHEAGGTITVDSEVGRGTCFSVYLPAHSDRLPVREDRAEEARGPLEGTLLLVEDDDQVRDVIARLVRGQGMGVLAAKDGVEALALFAAHSPEIRAILTDLSMPNMSGAEMLDRMQGLSAGTPLPPVIVLTGLADESVERLGRAGHRVMQKPVQGSELLQEVRSLLAPP